MGGRSVIRRKKEVCGLWSVPDDVFVDCLVQLSRLDLVALSMVSRRHQSFAVSCEFWAMRYRMDSVDPYTYVFIHMYPDPSPRWFVFHPVQRRLKRVHSSLYSAPLQGSCFVTTDCGIYTIGGLMDGKPTSEVTYFDFLDHTVYRVVPMKMARSGAAACLVKEDRKKKIYVFGGCWDDVAADNTSNWVEVFDLETGTWELLSVSTPKMPLKIQHSMAMEDGKRVYAVDEYGEIFIFSTSECAFWAGGETESEPENKNDWCLFGQVFFCRGDGGRILWRHLSESDWKEVKGLEELRGSVDIIKICPFSSQRVAIFWLHGPAYQTLELWFAEISLERQNERRYGVFGGTLSLLVLSSLTLNILALTCYLLILSISEYIFLTL